ncbi:MAG: ribonuclease H-like domain-containing protein, partial [Candidatus Krumholzibacteria bacterium]|nr:ribonuclease H-like domain-containing protein [Candidatus Krumholzibacteria bacterium]
KAIDPVAADEGRQFARLAGWPRYVEARMYSSRPSLRDRPVGGWEPPAFDREAACFLDIETTGLSPATYLFLIGLMYFRDGGFVVEQVFARHYGEEPAVLRYVHDTLKRFESLVTYNGARFDIPFIETRLAAHRGRPLEPIASVDLLYTARKEFRGILPNNRLGTVERHIRGIERTGDIPGAHIPGAYHDYVRTGDARAMKNVLYHNRMDLFTMAMLINRLQQC